MLTTIKSDMRLAIGNLLLLIGYGHAEVVVAGTGQTSNLIENVNPMPATELLQLPIPHRALEDEVRANVRVQPQAMFDVTRVRVYAEIAAKLEEATIWKAHVVD
jgi:hypothetical protein